jgi:beta-glucosidase-like glycosyl hydrolase
VTADDARTRAIEAGARAIVALERSGHVWTRRDEAAAVVDAVTPIIRADEASHWKFDVSVQRIEAEVRERIAQEIELEARLSMSLGVKTGMFDAACIARGGVQ